MKTHKFARKPFYVDAVRISEANMKEVAEWCGGEILEEEIAIDNETRLVSYIKVEVHRPLNPRQTQGFIGDWVLDAGSRNPQPAFKVYTPKAFDKSFEKVKHLTKAQADEAGIKVPHEPRPPKTETPVPTPPVLAGLEVVELDAEEEKSEPKVAPKSQASRMIDEVLNKQ